MDGAFGMLGGEEQGLEGGGLEGVGPCGASPCFFLQYGSCPGGSWVPLGGEMVLKCTFTLCNLPRVISCPRSLTGHVQTPFPSDEPTTSGRCLWEPVWLSWAGLGWRRALAVGLPAALLVLSPPHNPSGPRGQEPVRP